MRYKKYKTKFKDYFFMIFLLGGSRKRQRKKS